MPYTTTGSARIYYETRGPDEAEPLILIEGYTAQMIGWREGFLERLVGRGLRPVIFDNRDVGLSQMFGGEDDLDGHYTISDMAGDVLAVMDALGLDRAHVAGQSMGGIILQRLMIEAADRLKTATLIYTPPAAGRYRAGNLVAASAVDAPVRLARPQAIQAYVDRERLSASPGYAFDEDWARELGGRMYDRRYAPEGNFRQWAALQKPFDHLEALAGCDLPAAIIHGRDDALIRMQAALDLGGVLSNAELHIYPGMGHEVVEPLWDEFASIIARTVGRFQPAD